MAEYIERDALLKSIVNDVAPLNIAMVFRHIHNAPAADVAPVVYGRWLFAGDGVVECSVCHETNIVIPRLPRNYCSNCGAKMNGGESKVVGTAD